MAEWSSQAELKCAEADWDFADVFKHQFALLPDRAKPYPGWQCFEFASRHIHHCPDLPVSVVRCARGKKVAIILGIAIAEDGALLGPSHRLSFASTDGDFARKLRGWIEALAGRYVAIVQYGGKDWFFLDPSSSLGAVFCPDTGRVASSVSLLLDRALEQNPNYQPDDIVAASETYMFGQTADARIQRPYSNHAIDLSSMEQSRHWPDPEHDFTADIDRKPHAKATMAKLKANIAALSSAFVVSLPITAGRDSRILLAATMPDFDQIDHYFAYSVNWSTQVDALAGAEIAKLLGIPFQFIGVKPRRLVNAPKISDMKTLRNQMLWRSGFVSDGIDENAIHGAHVAPKVDILLRGGVLEMTRSHVWNRFDFETDDPISDQAVLGGMKITHAQFGDRYDPMLESLAEWRAGLSKTANLRVRDFAHLEFWLPSRPHVNFYVFTQSFFVNPFNDRALIEQTITAAPKYRKNGRFVNNLISQASPELAAMPYHKEMAEILRENRFSEVFHARGGFLPK